MGIEALDKDPIEPFGNPPHVPAQLNIHPNQHNHFLGPLQQHEQDDQQAPAPPIPQVNLQLALHGAVDDPALLEDDNVEEDHDPMPGWGHWAMPLQADVELHACEILPINELMEPL